MRTRKATNDVIVGMLISNNYPCDRARELAIEILNFLDEEDNLNIPPIENNL